VQSALSKYSSLVATEKVALSLAMKVLVNRLWSTQFSRHAPSYFASSALAGDTAGGDDPEVDDPEVDDPEVGDPVVGDPVVGDPVVDDPAIGESVVGVSDVGDVGAPEPPPPQAARIDELRTTARNFI